ncbi:hypothetical protein BDR04DRAFT_1170371 [Suillus decipiens]|nr:hypothetical protein BDR04DRAFT_1170371 [Suillus decipiens]
MSGRADRQAAPIYGDHHGYYSNCPFIGDLRLALLPSEFFVGKRVLDAGYNDSPVTCEIGMLPMTRGAHQVIGVDIEDALSGVFSLTMLEISMRVSLSHKRQRLLGDAATTDNSAHKYFPPSCEHSYGPLPIPDRATKAFTHNITFRTVDWAKDEILEDKTLRVITDMIRFSVSKWIHLNKDEGLEEFFH